MQTETKLSDSSGGRVKTDESGEMASRDDFKSDLEMISTATIEKRKKRWSDFYRQMNECVLIKYKIFFDTSLVLIRVLSSCKLPDDLVSFFKLIALERYCSFYFLFF